MNNKTALRAVLAAHDIPIIVCLCGSTRFTSAWQKAQLEETLAGRIVLTVGNTTHPDDDLIAREIITPEVKVQLDILHKKKIDLADEILVLNVGGYLGSSTKSEIAHAISTRKRIRFLEKFTTLEPDASNEARVECALVCGLER